MSKIISLFQNFDSAVNLTTKVLKKGGVIIYPTDTIYGIGCDATNKAAVESIFLIKNREAKKPMLMLVNGIEMVNKYVDNVSIYAEKIISKFWPGSVTIIFNANKNVPELLKSNDGKIAFRYTNNEFCNSLINNLGCPLVSTSANLSANNSINNFEQLIFLFQDKVDLLIEGSINSDISSTIIDTTGSQPKIIRQGNLFIDLEKL